jgi:hypothetical protein
MSSRPSRQAKLVAILKIKEMYRSAVNKRTYAKKSEAQPEPITEPATTEPATTELLQKPINVEKNTFICSLAIKHKTPKSLIKAIQDSTIKKILEDNIAEKKEKKTIKIKSKYKIHYKVFNSISREDKINLIAYLTSSLSATTSM